MTALEALAWTLPPSLALVTIARLQLLEQRQRALNAEQLDRIDALAERARRLEHDGESYTAHLTVHTSELARLADQVSILADRR